MKRISLLLGFVLCSSLIGCERIYGPVVEANAFADKKEEVLSQMGKKLEANPTEAGVDEARTIFEAHKDSLIAKRDFLKTAPQGFNATGVHS